MKKMSTTPSQDIIHILIASFPQVWYMVILRYSSILHFVGHPCTAFDVERSQSDIGETLLIMDCLAGHGWDGKGQSVYLTIQKAKRDHHPMSDLLNPSPSGMRWNTLIPVKNNELTPSGASVEKSHTDPW